ncbi:MAG TPA: hypothetical protein VLT33_13750 [Labilithrix sp.]|nr:hypothetical protein [Labilithrix sp.]
MTSRDAPLRFLTQLAASASTEWRTVGSDAFLGDLSLTTDNSAYRFHHGMFVSRAKNSARFFDAPRAMRGLMLIGFLHEDDANDRWTLSTSWRAGSHAVLWRLGGTDATSFILTSPTGSFTLEAPQPKADPDPSPWIARRAPSHSGILPRRSARPPSCRMPLPPSMTRLHSAASVPSER